MLIGFYTEIVFIGLDCFWNLSCTSWPTKKLNFTTPDWSRAWGHLPERVIQVWPMVKTSFSHLSCHSLDPKLEPDSVLSFWVKVKKFSLLQKNLLKIWWISFRLKFQIICLQDVEYFQLIRPHNVCKKKRKSSLDPHFGTPCRTYLPKPKMSAPRI